MEQPLDQLRKNSYAVVTFAIDRAQILKAVEAFRGFLSLDDEIKKHIDFTIAPQHRRGDVGYKFRRAENDIYDDNKEFFHYHPAVHEEYAEFIQQHPLLENFLNHAKPIWEEAYRRVADVMEAFETTYPGIKDRIFATDKPHVLIRFLQYHFESAGKYLAKPHYDAGAFTLAIAESQPGLRIGSGPEDLELIEHKEKQGVFMISSNYEKVMGEADLKASWHDVIQTDESQLGQDITRWAVVAFIDAHGVEALSRTETHKWYKAS